MTGTGVEPCVLCSQAKEPTYRSAEGWRCCHRQTCGERRLRHDGAFAERLEKWMNAHEHAMVELRTSPRMAVIRFGEDSWFGHGESVRDAFEAAVVAWEATRRSEN